MHLDERAVNDVIQRVLKNVERVLSEDGHRAVLGIVAGPDDPAGVHITGITPDGPAHDAGLRSGDIILEVDGVSLAANGHRPIETLLDFLRRAQPGENVAVHFRRNGRDRYTDVALGDLADLPALDLRDTDLQDRWSDIELVALTPTLGRYFGTPDGLLVVRAPVDGAADLRDGDVILRIGERRPLSPEHALRILGSYQPGEEFTVELMREGRTSTLRFPVVGTDEGLRVDGALRDPVYGSIDQQLDAACVMRRL